MRFRADIVDPSVSLRARPLGSINQPQINQHPFLHTDQILSHAFVSLEKLARTMLVILTRD